MNEILGTGRTFRLRINVVAGIVCALMALPLCFARVNPFLRPRSYAAEQKTKLADLRERQVALCKSLGRHREQLASLRAGLRKHKIRLESAGNVNQRIAELAKLAEATGLAVDGVQPGEANRLGPYTMVPANVQATGTYPTCVAFLRALKQTFPDTSVDSFDLTRRPDATDGSAGFRVQLLWYTTTGERTEK